MNCDRKCKYGREFVQLDCKICTMYGMCNMTKKKGKIEQVRLILTVKPEQEMYLVFTAKKLGDKETVILKGTVGKIMVESAPNNKITVLYSLYPKKCVNGHKDLTGYDKLLFFKDANIDTGYRGFGIETHYPVFTTKEKCMEWLKK